MALFAVLGLALAYGGEARRFWQAPDASTLRGRRDRDTRDLAALWSAAPRAGRRAPVVLNARKLAAIDIAFLGAGLIIAEYAIGVLLSVALGPLMLLRGAFRWPSHRQDVHQRDSGANRQEERSPLRMCGPHYPCQASEPCSSSNRTCQEGGLKGSHRIGSGAEAGHPLL